MNPPASLAQTAPLAALAQRFAFNETFLDQLTRDFEDRDWLHREGEVNHAQWLLGHLAATRRWALREMVIGQEEEPWERHFGKGSKSTAQSDDISPAMLRESFIKNGELLRRHLLAQDPAQAAAPFRPFPDGSTTLAGGAHFLHFHESYHLGQIGLIRRLLGKPGAG
jgi:hypothetical protein